MLQHVSYPRSQSRTEVFEDEMRVLLRDGRLLVRADVMSEGYVVEGEEDSRAMGEM